MVRKKEIDTTRIWASIPTELHNFIAEYNVTATRPVNMTNLIIQSFKDEIEKIKNEQLEKKDTV
jgi:hypothetical protein